MIVVFRHRLQTPLPAFTGGWGSLVVFRGSLCVKGWHNGFHGIMSANFSRRGGECLQEVTSGAAVLRRTIALVLLLAATNAFMHM